VIAEAWDAGGLYDVGSSRGRPLVSGRRFRDDIRRFVRGDPGLVAAVARASPAARLYGWSRRPPQSSINFVTCRRLHLNDTLSSRDDKHNESNGEGNRDGIDENLS